MKTPGHRGQEVVGMTDIGPDTSNGKQAEAGWRQSHDGLEQRVGELEQQVAELSAKNAELARERLLLRTLIDNLPDLVFIKDSQQRFIVTNTACNNELANWNNRLPNFRPRMPNWRGNAFSCARSLTTCQTWSLSKIPSSGLSSRTRPVTTSWRIGTTGCRTFGQECRTGAG